MPFCLWCGVEGREISLALIGIELTKILRFQQKTGSCMEVRLYTPRGKIITNMTNDQVDLTLEDILGASFSEEEIEKIDRCSSKVLVEMPPYKSKW